MKYILIQQVIPTNDTLQIKILRVFKKMILLLTKNAFKG